MGVLKITERTKKIDIPEIPERMRPGIPLHVIENSRLTGVLEGNGEGKRLIRIEQEMRITPDLQYTTVVRYFGLAVTDPHAISFFSNLAPRLDRAPGKIQQVSEKALALGPRGLPPLALVPLFAMAQVLGVDPGIAALGSLIGLATSVGMAFTGRSGKSESRQTRSTDLTGRVKEFFKKNRGGQKRLDFLVRLSSKEGEDLHLLMKAALQSGANADQVALAMGKIAASPHFRGFAPLIDYLNKFDEWADRGHPTLVSPRVIVTIIKALRNHPNLTEAESLQLAHRLRDLESRTYDKYELMELIGDLAVHPRVKETGPFFETIQAINVSPWTQLQYLGILVTNPNHRDFQAVLGQAVEFYARVCDEVSRNPDLRYGLERVQRTFFEVLGEVASHPNFQDFPSLFWAIRDLGLELWEALSSIAAHPKFVNFIPLLNGASHHRADDYYPVRNPQPHLGLEMMAANAFEIMASLFLEAGLGGKWDPIRRQALMDGIIGGFSHSNPEIRLGFVTSIRYFFSHYSYSRSNPRAFGRSLLDLYLQGTLGALKDHEREIRQEALVILRDVLAERIKPEHRAQIRKTLEDLLNDPKVSVEEKAEIRKVLEEDTSGNGKGGPGSAGDRRSEIRNELEGFSQFAIQGMGDLIEGF